MAGIKIARDANGDWLAVIKDDEVIYQGHSITPEMVLDVLGIDFSFIGEYDLTNAGWFPDKLSEWDQIKKIA